jgi:tetratricopeptide (TPR) repeat protein
LNRHFFGTHFVAVAFMFGCVSSALEAQQGAQGKIIFVQGRVDSAPASNQEVWNPASLFQELFVSDRVRTLTASRSSILFIDETQVKLNAGAVLTVQQVKTPGGPSTTLNLLEGEGWFRTKNPASGLTIRTPGASATIRGTEINLVVTGNDAVLTVAEGAAEFSNDAGSILVEAGEEATATPGQLPTKRTLLNPEDAVQWVLYYPVRVAWHDLPAPPAGPSREGFDRLRAGDTTAAMTAFQTTLATDPWSRLGAAMVFRQLGDSTQAQAALAEGIFPGALDIERRAELAAAALVSGDAVTARREIEGALAIDSTALRPLVMLSELELTQNRKVEAAELARRAIAAHEDSVAAHVAAAEAAQAAFDLETARRELDRAVAIDPSDVRALVNRARLRFGVGDTVGARRDADRAAAIDPADASLRSLLGFIELAAGDETAARRDFEAAVGRDPALGEPHLGLGLMHFRNALFDQGLLEMLTATLLEPKVSLYQSYLGKAYYELRRFPEGLAALASAKRLDPRDPTPWLYTSFFLRDQNRQVDALDELRRAIALNDNRAVYRSRLLLDRDLATKNVSLARLYNQLGFDAWGAYEALNSLNADLTNASAHLFMADTYGNLPDRTQALSSELDQYFLYSPVNLNSFNNFSEYTSLLERPLNEFTLTQDGGNLGHSSTNLRNRSGSERLAHLAFVTYTRGDGARLDASDYRVQGTGEVKVSFNPSTDLFLILTGVKQEKGKDPDNVETIGTFPFQVSVNQIVAHPDPTFVRTVDLANLTAGFKRSWRVGSAFTFKADALHVGNTSRNPDSATAACGSALGIVDLTPLFAHSDARFSLPYRGVALQSQQVMRFGRHQIVGGGDYTRRRKTSRCQDFVTSSVYSGSISADESHRATERATAVYVRDDIEVRPWLHVTIGGRFVDGVYEDPQSEGNETRFRRLNPYAGASVRVSQSTVIQAAAFRNTNSDFLSSNIWPPTVAGFALERNELPTTKRDEGALALQHSRRRSFLELRGFVRRSQSPAFQVSPHDPNPIFAQYAGYLTPPDADFWARGISVFLNAILTRRLSLFADEQLVIRDALIVNRRDNQVRVGVNYIHPRGLFARVSTQAFRQRFFDTTVTGLPDGSYVLTDVTLQYEFARKHGLLTWTIANLFDRRFQTVVEDLAVESPLPYRTMVVSLRWRL